MGSTPLYGRSQPGGAFSIIDMPNHPGNIWWVGSGEALAAEAAGNGINRTAPFSTLAYAFSSDVLASGDTVYVLPGHTETIIAAGGIAADIAGVKVIGLGEGSKRPTFSFTTDTAASIAISAASIRNRIQSPRGEAITRR